MSRKTLGAGRFLQLVEVDGWEFVERRNLSGVVAIAAITEDNHFLLVEQQRRPVGATVIELPAGLCGDEVGATDEPLTEAARRELLEETGYEVPGGVRNFKHLFTTPSSAGLTNEVVTVFGVRGARKVAAGGGVAGENIVVHALRLEEIDAWLAARVSAGALIDAKVFVGLHFAKQQADEQIG
jgi:ADP-ribose pyrophosphatase